MLLSGSVRIAFPVRPISRNQHAGTKKGNADRYRARPGGLAVIIIIIIIIIITNKGQRDTS